MIDFEILYKRYPNKEGKRKGMDKLAKTIKTKEEYDKFELAMDNYIQLCINKKRIQGGFVKQWSTFVNNWTDYLVEGIVEEPKSNNISQLEKIMKGEL